MNPINVTDHFNKIISEDMQREMIADMIKKQLASVERLMDSTRGLVKSPSNFNLCDSLIKQLAFYSEAAYISNHTPCEYSEGNIVPTINSANKAEEQ